MGQHKHPCTCWYTSVFIVMHITHSTAHNENENLFMMASSGQCNYEPYTLAIEVISNFSHILLRHPKHVHNILTLQAFGKHFSLESSDDLDM